MDDAKRFVRNAQKIHSDNGGDLYLQFGGILRCTECGVEHLLNATAIGMYLSSGWPKHCGYTMRWVTQKELDAE